MRRPWLPLRPRRDNSRAVGARRGARSHRGIERLLSPPIDPRLEVLKRSTARRAECGVVRLDRRMAHSTLLGFEGSDIGASLTRGIAGTRDQICSVWARGKETHVVNVRPFPERVLNGFVRRGIRPPSALAASQEHASLGRREVGNGSCPRSIGGLDQLPPDCAAAVQHNARARARMDWSSVGDRVAPMYMVPVNLAGPVVAAA